MEALSVGEIARAAQGVLMNFEGEYEVSGVSIDSREINPGDMFVALKGENFDGHDFIQKAVENGAVLVVAHRMPECCKIPYILVEDTLKALQDIASYYRSKFHIPVVAITGSSGKTTTKDMMASVLSQKFNVLKTEGNFNNAIGLPLTLFRLQHSHQIAVLEMGMSSLGEISLLSKTARPSIGVISNVGLTHIEKLGSRENILRAKLELFSYFNSDSTAVINGDNDMLHGFRSDKFRVIRYGLSQSNDIFAYGIEEKGEAGIEFCVDSQGLRSKFELTLPGIHNVYNALSAIAVARLFDMKAEEIQRGLDGFSPSEMRMEIINLGSGAKLINDVYNANPESMKAAIDVLRAMKSEGRSICILGDMLELGELSPEEHYKIGMYAACSGADVIAAVGKFSEDVRRGAMASGMGGSIYVFSDIKDAAEFLNDIIKPGDTVLIKGSRGMKMEYIVDYLRERG